MNTTKVNWVPSEKDNHEIISKTYYLIKLDLEKLQNQIQCPDKFIYEFLGQIQKEWHHESCQSIVRNYKNK